jgi:acetylglutamate kinase
MPYVDMVLCGAVNKRLVRMLGAAGVPAVGLSGSDGAMFTGAPLAGTAASEDGNHTAEVAQVDTRLPRLLLEHGYLPVIAPTSVQPPGRAVNINADSVALRLAPALAADRLLFLSDVPGILKEGAVLAALTPDQAGAEIASGTISGGMIPKVEAALHALTQGVRRVVIGQFSAPGDLGNLLTGATGTTMLPHTHDHSPIESKTTAQQPTQEVR